MDLNDARQYLNRRISAGEPFDALLAYPRYFEIETVNACNARCPMCTIDEWQRHSPTMKMPLFTKIADDIGAHASVVKRVSLYRDGEPLLDKRMADRVAMLKERGVRETSIATNVSLLDEAKARALLDAGLDLDERAEAGVADDPGGDLVADLDMLQLAGQRAVLHLDRIEFQLVIPRSEERRVGKECRSRWSPYH